MNTFDQGTTRLAATLKVDDLAETVYFFTQRLGFRVEMIVPADDPQVAVLFGQGLRIRLESTTLSPSTNAATHDDQVEKDSKGNFVVRRLSESHDWHEGRAGMYYRDLITGRLNGLVVASHIRIPDGGVVPDYVHYHKVSFQMIYCKAGWVRVVYEDQGEPFVMEAGDCVLQPPRIRHRVLEASRGLEVVELGCPAVHETWADHKMTLPTKRFTPEREFGDQRFVWHRVNRAQWIPWRLEGFSARDTGIAAATKGLASVKVVRADAPCVVQSDPHAGEFIFLFILKGELGIKNVAHLRTGDSCVIPANMVYTLRAAADLEMLEVALSHN
jgi:quercetin dioxygenase-like cupin family protein